MSPANLIPRDSGQYDEEAGQIIYSVIDPIDGKSKPVTGTFMCLTPRTLGSQPVHQCRNVIKTDHARYWGLDMPSINAIPTARGLAAGDRISLEGDIVRNVPTDWHPRSLAHTERIDRRRSESTHPEQASLGTDRTNRTGAGDLAKISPHFDE